VTGHSLGGSVAALMMPILHLAKGAPPGLGALKCAVFGAPPVFSRTLSTKLAKECGVVRPSIQQNNRDEAR
jgi:hypothetical protein